MRDIRFRAWHIPEKKMYYRGYQKWTHVLLCDPDPENPESKGLPVMRVRFKDCELMECTDIEDIRGHLVFEGDVVKIQSAGQTLIGMVSEVPDMFRSRHLHPLHCILEKHGISDQVHDLNVEILGNRFEHPDLIARILIASPESL